MMIAFELPADSAEAQVIRTILAMRNLQPSDAWAIVAADFKNTCEQAVECPDLLMCLADEAEDFVSEDDQPAPRGFRVLPTPAQ